MTKLEVVDYKNLLTAVSLKQLRGSVVGTGSGHFDKEREQAKRAVAERVVGKAKKSFGSWTDLEGDSVDVVNELRKEGERNPRINEVLRRAVDIFNDPDKATAWLNSPNYALGDQIPLRLLETEEGIALILDKLGRIEHGVII